MRTIAIWKEIKSDKNEREKKNLHQINISPSLPESHSMPPSSPPHQQYSQHQYHYPKELVSWRERKKGEGIRTNMIFFFFRNEEKQKKG